ncbi:MAG: 3-methyl-2-oxobutanoate hydroxymethyltransferase [Fibrobacter sp.]|nr:3-methyl-2-oxobutanoate hydroxymethyltransferase [Fibrobacter sp.]
MLTAQDIAQSKNNRKISMITAYDANFARMAQAAEIDMLLVGDSAANVLLGLESTRDVGMAEMLILTAAVSRGAPDTHIVADMPWESEQNPEMALSNAQKFLQAGAHSVKLEGFKPEIISHLLQNDVPVVAHLGLLPQSAEKFTQQGQSPEEAERIKQEAQALSKLGVFAMVLEHIPSDLGAEIARHVKSVVIGIGAGDQVDGQVLVIHDALGLHPFKVPPFAQKFADLYAAGVEGLRKYKASVG